MVDFFGGQGDFSFPDNNAKEKEGPCKVSGYQEETCQCIFYFLDDVESLLCVMMISLSSRDGQSLLDLLRRTKQ